MITKYYLYTVALLAVYLSFCDIVFIFIGLHVFSLSLSTICVMLRGYNTTLVYLVISPRLLSNVVIIYTHKT